MWPDQICLGQSRNLDDGHSQNRSNGMPPYSENATTFSLVNLGDQADERLPPSKLLRIPTLVPIFIL